MFGKKNKTTAFAAGGTTLISRNTEIVGDIRFSGTLIIEGYIKGSVYSVDGEHALVRVMESGRVEGEMRVPSLVINGHVAGDVYSNKHIELAAKTLINGNVHYALIEMVKGAQVNGKLVYSPEVAEEKVKGKEKVKPSLIDANQKAGSQPVEKTTPMPVEVVSKA